MKRILISAIGKEGHDKRRVMSQCAQHPAAASSPLNLLSNLVYIRRISVEYISRPHGALRHSSILVRLYRRRGERVYPDREF
jgi:hypothetical protein